ncbi:MAG: hypothetical protein ACOYLS_14540 [Polymorphobacter sp.]
MTPRILSQVGLVFLLSAIAVLLFSVYRSLHGTPSTGLSSFGTVLLVLGIGIRMRARKVGS